MYTLPQLIRRNGLSHAIRLGRFAQWASLLLGAIVPGAALRAQLNYATPYHFTTFAGASGLGFVDGTGSAARFNNPNGVAVDSAGNVYVADTTNSAIRKVTPAGVVTTLASSGQNINAPVGVAVDAAGIVYVANTGDHTIRKIALDGSVTVIAGNPTVRGFSDGTGPGNTTFSEPSGVTVDVSGNLFVTDSANNTIRKITLAGVVTTLAGLHGPVGGSDDGTGTAARFAYPVGIVVDSSGDLYVADRGNNTIRKVTGAGVVTTIAGTAGVTGSADGTGSAAQFSWPSGVAVDSSGNLFVADTLDYTIRKIAPGGVVTTFAGAVSSLVPNGGGSDDGTANSAKFLNPTGLAVDGSGNIYVADSANQTVRKISPAAAVTTIAGLSSYGAENGPRASARFFQPQAVAVDGANNLYIADTDNNVIRKITSGGVVTTLAGSASNPGSTDGTGDAARFYHPCALAVDAAGYIYVADTLNSTIRKISPGGVVTTLAGSPGVYGATDGVGSAASFSYCRGIALDGAGNVYVSDTTNATIRKIAVDGNVMTLAGTAGSAGFTDGTGSTARFTNPYGLAVDGNGNVLVADSSNQVIRKVTPAGVVTTFCGHPGGSPPVDGPIASARFGYPRGIAVDGTGNIYVSDYVGDTIRRITSQGMVTTLAGVARTMGQGDGIGSAAQFNFPQGLAVDSSGNLYVADVFNSAIRRGIVSVRGDFNSDGDKDIVWENTVTGDHALWLMHGTVFSGSASLGSLSSAWRVAGAADFNSDDKTDLLWENTVTGDRMVWVMDGTNHVSTDDLGIVSTAWRMVATADFNGDTKTDIMLENTVTGERVVWLMDGATVTSTISYGTIPTQWRIAASADFNHDGSIDIVWENTVTGQHAIWLMNGTVFGSAIDFGSIPTEWRLATVGDFNGDGDADFFWENTVTGDRALWLMHGTIFSTSIYFGSIPTDWNIAP